MYYKVTLGKGIKEMEKPMTEIFSHNLRNALYMKGMTQAELAKAVKTTETSVSKWINGAVVPRPKMVDEICRVLKVTRADLMIDREKTALIAPADVLADEMRQRPELYNLFSSILSMNSNDIELMSKLAERLSK